MAGHPRDTPTPLDRRYPPRLLWCPQSPIAHLHPLEMGTRGTPESGWGPWDAISAAGGCSRPETPQRAPPHARASAAPPSHVRSARPTCFPARRTWPAACLPRHVGLAACSALSTAGMSHRPGRSMEKLPEGGGQGPCTPSPKQSTRVGGPIWVVPPLLGGGATQLLLRFLQSPTRPWEPHGCQLHAGCWLFGVVGPALKELPSWGTNKLLTCGGGQQKGASSG